MVLYEEKGDYLMPYLNKDEFMVRIKERIGEDMSDDAVSFIEDASDTYDELIRRSSDTEDWKTKYEENDAQWRQKYRERFFTSAEEIKDEQEENVKDDGEPRSFEDLFEEREG